MTSAEQTITVTREFDAAPGDVYAAWTEPKLMRRWMAQQVEADVRVGGRYRNELIGDDGQRYVHSGEYRVLEPGRRIVQTFRGAGIADADAASDHGEYLEVTLRSLGPARTELTLADCWDGDGMDEDGRAAVKAAWNGWLDHLAQLFRAS